MSRQATAFVLGYHGCDQNIAKRAVDGDIKILKSARDYDWLGPGAYFWESDPQRALEWAQWKVSKGAYASAALIGAVIDLRNCLDPMSRTDLTLVRVAYASFKALQQKADLPLPENKSAPGNLDEDRVLRFLDCAVLRHLHSTIESVPEGNAPLNRSTQ